MKLGNLFGKNLAQEVSQILTKEKPVFRFNNGFEKLGAQVRPADTRTNGEVMAAIETLAERNPDIKVFVSELKNMKPEHMRLASDTMELAGKSEMLMASTNINLNKTNIETRKSPLQAILGILPKASKENPAILDFAQEVINNTDTITAKYFLCSLPDNAMKTNLAEHFKAARPFVKDIAESTINGGYTGDLSKQRHFMDTISVLVNGESKPEKIAMLSKLTKAADEIEGQNPIYLDAFVRSNTPERQVEENLDTVVEVANNALKQGKSIDIVDFVNHNVNLY